MPTVTFKPMSGIDDGFINTEGYPNFSNGSAAVDVGKHYWNDRTPSVYNAFIRFPNVIIPKNATITSAVITLIALSNDYNPTVNLKIIAEASDNPAPVSSYSDYNNRLRTAALVLWLDVPAWERLIAYQPPDIKAVIQELVNRSGWASGNAIQIFIQEDGSHDSDLAETECMRRACTYEYPLAPGTGEYAAQLTITYEEVVPPQYQLTISTTTGGTTSPMPGTYVADAGALISVQAIPNQGYLFDHWSLDGANVGSTNPIIVTMNTNHTLQAVFVSMPPTTHIVHVNSSPVIGVPVTVDGQSVGATPTPAIILEEGNHGFSVPQEVIA